MNREIKKITILPGINKFGKKEKVLEEISKRMGQAFDKIWKFKEENGLSSGEAAFSLALTGITKDIR